MLIYLLHTHSDQAEQGRNPMNSNIRKPNHLINEKSPYLLQHAHNPVDWYPWTEEAFEKAKMEDKPIFLSIGYSTCHWCHVMERESFEDEDIAKLLNDGYVCIKVDREERPDIDSIYMNVCSLVTGRGGWPLTIIMTSDKRPFFAATYLPKEGKYGMVGLMDLLTGIAETWQKDRRKLNETAEKITGYFLEYGKARTIREDLTEKVLDEAFTELLDSFDHVNGGFGTRPKFPTIPSLLFLLRYWKRNGNQQALEMVEKTLQNMRRGGIYDQVGFGFHRYSTDSGWLVPHFEKMLYDQALNSLAYIEAYQATGKKEYRKTAEEIFEYVVQVMTHQKGAFYSAEDADSEGQEGKFYLWTEAEIEEKLGHASSLLKKAFRVSSEGNYADEVHQDRTGRNILHLEKPTEALAAELNMSDEELLNELEKARRVLLNARESRIRPAKDDKILTDWNGLMIAAFSKAAQVFNETGYSSIAKKAAEFILENLQTIQGRLLHRYRGGEATILGNADDYAFFIFGLTELYEATFEPRFLQEAVKLQQAMIEHFWDQENGGFFFTADDSEQLLVRSKQVRDGAVPSGNSIGLLNLTRLARLTGKTDLESKASKLAAAFASEVSDMPSYYTMFLSSIDFLLGPSYEIVLTGNSEAQDTDEMLKAIRTKFNPNQVVLFKSLGDTQLAKLVHFVADMKSIENKATVYVCRNFTCSAPTTEVRKLGNILRGNQTPP